MCTNVMIMMMMLYTQKGDSVQKSIKGKKWWSARQQKASGDFSDEKQNVWRGKNRKLQVSDWSKRWGESCAFVYKRENKNCMFRCAIGTDCYRSSLRFTHNFAALNSCNKKRRNSQWSVVGRENITLKVREWWRRWRREKSEKDIADIKILYKNIAKLILWSGKWEGVRSQQEQVQSVL